MLGTMFCFLPKTIFPQTHRQITAVSRTSNQLVSVSVQNQNSISNVQPFTVSYLINTCEFSPEKAVSASKFLKFQSREKPDLIIEFFEKQGFSQTQVFRIIRAVPILLLLNTEKIILPKIQFLKSKGVPCSDIPQIIVSCPEILLRSLERQIIPSFDFFMNLFQSKVEFIKSLKRFSGILLVNTHVVPNIKVLSEVGVPEWNIVKIIEEHPWALKNKQDRFKEIVAEVKEMGLDPLMAVFVSAVGTIASVSKSTWTKKANLYKKWGWSDDELLAAFGRYPKCITVSEHKIEKIMDFIVNEMGYESFKIARNPALLGMSFNKRILPRGSVFRVLLSKGLAKKISLSRLFFPSENVFLEKFITHHENEANELLKLYQAKMHVEE